MSALESVAAAPSVRENGHWKRQGGAKSYRSTSVDIYSGYHVEHPQIAPFVLLSADSSDLSLNMKLAPDEARALARALESAADKVDAVRAELAAAAGAAP